METPKVVNNCYGEYMKRYDERILHLLLDRYENSLLYEEKNKVNISIFVPVNKRTLPEYFDVTSTAYDTIQEQLKELEAKGYLTLEWGKRKKHILEKCILNTGYADEIYRMLKRTPRKEKEQAFLYVCQKLYDSFSSEICTRFLEWMINRICAGESVKEYADIEDSIAFERIVRLLHAIETNKDEIFLRQLSIRVFHDSKIAEQEIHKVARILMQFGATSNNSSLKYNPGGNLFTSEKLYEEILAEYHIFRNPSWIMLKGNGAFYMEKEDLSPPVYLKTIPGGIGVSNEDIGNIKWSSECRPAYVITIENLTSFHQWKKSDDGLCIYLGGYANTPVRRMLMSLYRCFPDIPYYHFGDMDCGGFLIWKNLCESTGISFVLKEMDLQTYEKYKIYGRELTSHDRKQLSEMMEDDWFADYKKLFQHMLSEGLKIEQECIITN